MGDLLKRASHDEAAAQHAPPANTYAPAPPDRGAVDVAALANALDVTSATGIWARFRAGQRGFMVRSVYLDAGRFAFDEANQRYRSEPAFRDNVNRFLLDFEGLLRDTEMHDQGAVQATLVSDVGRVYLLLAHVAGRLM